MSRISIELVPRSLASLEADLRLVRERFPAVWLRARDADAYFMPIRADLVAWLGGLL